MDNENSSLLAIISYLGFLVIIPLIIGRGDDFTFFHAKEGLNLLIFEVLIISSISLIAPFLWIIGNILQSIVVIFCIMLSFVGMVNAKNGLKKRIPLMEKIGILKNE